MKHKTEKNAKNKRMKKKRKEKKNTLKTTTEKWLQRHSRQIFATHIHTYVVTNIYTELISCKYVCESMSKQTFVVTKIYIQTEHKFIYFYIRVCKI